MNFRVFSSEGELRDGLREAIDRATASALSPHVGIVGELEPWLGAVLSNVSTALRLAGHPANVQQAIETHDGLVRAGIADLGEPLDLVIIVGPPPASVPLWLIDARMRFVAVIRRENLAAWRDDRNDQLDRGWFFVLEDHWIELVGSMGDRLIPPGDESANGDELE